MTFKSIIGVACTCLVIVSFNINANTVVGPQVLSDGRTVDLQGLEWQSTGAGLSRDQVEATVLDSDGGGWQYASMDQTEKLMASLFGDGSQADIIAGAEWFVDAFGETNFYNGPASEFNYGLSDECGLNASCVSGVNLDLDLSFVVVDATICYISSFGGDCAGPSGGAGPVPDNESNGAAHLLVREIQGRVTFEFSEYEEAENGSGLTLKVNRVGGSDGEITVNYSSTDGSAKANTDYEPISGKLTFADGDASSKTISVNFIDDAEFEGDEDFSIELSGVTGAAKLGDNAIAKITIEENDPAPSAGSLRFSGESYDADEDDSTVRVTVQRVNGDFGAVSVDYSTTDGTAVAGSDYQPAIGTLTFEDGEISKFVDVEIINDSVFEDDESFVIELSNAQGGAELEAISSATINVEDDDPAPSAGVLQFEEESYSIDENGTSLNVTVSREDGSAGAISVSFSTENGTATAGEDYISVSGNIDFADGVTSRNVSVPITNDNNFEGDESFSMMLSNPQGGATLGAQENVQVTIIEDDAAPLFGVLKFSGESFSKGENEGLVEVTVQRVNGSAGQVTVDFTTDDVTAIASVDYQPTSGTLTFADGDLSKVVSIPLINDSIFEGDEIFNVVLSSPQGGAVLDSVTTTEVVIVEDDAAPQAGVIQFSGPAYNVGEDESSVVVRVTRENGSSGTVSVNYSTADGTAIAGEDYQSVSGTLTFADGDTSRTVVVTIIDDSVFEGNKTLSMKLSDPQGDVAVGALSSTTITIAEDEANPDEGNVNPDGGNGNNSGGDGSNSSGGDGVSNSGGVTGSSASSPLFLILLVFFAVAARYRRISHY